ncbi:MAG: pyrimidine 5'-nucleotidase [Pseudomonadota bacterium]
MATDKAAFDRIENWVFDLDNTLYPARCHLFAQIDARMSSFIRERLEMSPEEARKLQKAYYVQYGTTLSGLMIEHKIAPDDFLAHVHDIDVSHLPENPLLAAGINALEGRKFIFTNGSVAHAENVLDKLGIDAGFFTDIFDIRAAEFTPKPHRQTYEKFLEAGRIKPARAAMFEDLAHNLEAPHALGMTTVLVCDDVKWFADEPAKKRPASLEDDHGDHIHHVTDDLTGFVQHLAGNKPTSHKPSGHKPPA